MHVTIRGVDGRTAKMFESDCAPLVGEAVRWSERGDDPAELWNVVATVTSREFKVPGLPPVTMRMEAILVADIVRELEPHG